MQSQTSWKRKVHEIKIPLVHLTSNIQNCICIHKHKNVLRKKMKVCACKGVWRSKKKYINSNKITKLSFLLINSLYLWSLQHTDNHSLQFCQYTFLHFHTSSSHQMYSTMSPIHSCNLKRKKKNVKNNRVCMIIIHDNYSSLRGHTFFVIRQGDEGDCPFMLSEVIRRWSVLIFWN